MGAGVPAFEKQNVSSSALDPSKASTTFRDLFIRRRTEMEFGEESDLSLPLA